MKPRYLAIGFLVTALAGSGVVYDLRTRSRPHPVYVLGGLGLLISGPLRFALSQTSAWHAIARSLVEHT